MRPLALLLLAAALPAQSWQPLTPTTSPTPRLHAPAAYDPFRGVTTLFGGDGACTALNDTWEFTGATWTPRLSVVRPSARAGHGFAFDLRRQRAVLFGGLRPGLGVAGDTWEWDGSTWLQRTPATAPPARAFAAMAYDATRGVTVLFGGEGSGGALLGDTWEWDGATWQLRALATAPTARRHAAMAGDEVRREIVLFGGDDGAQTLGDTWTFDGVQWQVKPTPQAPGPRQQAALAGDGNFGRLVLLGGLHNGSALADAWAWDGSAWSPLAGAVPPARRGHALAFDAQRGATVCFGGSDTAACSGARADTWELASPAVRQMTVVAPPVVGQTAQFRYDYPAAAGANHFYWHLVTLRQPAAFPVPIPGFPSLGLCRVDLFNMLGDATGFLDASGQNVLSLAVPNQPAVAGFGFDVQAVDLDFWTMTLRWAGNDADVYVRVANALPPAALNMVLIQPGTFLMGSEWMGDRSVPVHPVTISQPFWIGKYEVTQADYLSVMGFNNSYFQAPNFPSGPQRPVEGLTWAQAVAYCSALNAIEDAAGRVPAGYRYRLPTEAEWEYCCRAGTTTEFHVGNDITCVDANMYYGGFCVPAPSGGQTSVVGSYPPNAWGLHDMHGNVAEWCVDAWTGTNDYPYGHVIDPVGGQGSTHPLRGGRFASYSNWTSSGARPIPGASPFACGMRVVLAPELP